MSSEHVDTVGEAYESGTACRIGPSGAIVADGELEDTVTRFYGDVHRGSVRVLGGIRERFRDDVIGGHLHRRWKPRPGRHLKG